MNYFIILSIAFVFIIVLIKKNSSSKLESKNNKSVEHYVPIHNDQYPKPHYFFKNMQYWIKICPVFQDKDLLYEILSIDRKRTIVVHCETTGLNLENNEILQLSIINGNGDILFNHFFKPKRRIKWNVAQSYNGISPKMVENCEPISSYLDEIINIFANADLIIGFNLYFVLRFLGEAGITTNGRYITLFDLMIELSPICGRYIKSEEYYAYPRLDVAANRYQYYYSPNKNSLEDCKAILYCYNCMIIDTKKTGYMKLCEIGDILEWRKYKSL